jgi:hypothetical protein
MAGRELLGKMVLHQAGTRCASAPLIMRSASALAMRLATD